MQSTTALIAVANRRSLRPVGRDGQFARSTSD
jgi:hypothetical protein